MSRKSNRLKNRLRIEQERAAKAGRELQADRRRLDADWRKLRADEKNLERSVALRIRVERDFTRPSGDAFALNLVIYPREYAISHRYLGPPGARNASFYAAMRGQEAGKQVEQVILRCLLGELEEFRNAR